MRKILCLLACVALTANCAGGRAAIQLKKLQVPVSMSAYLFGPSGERVSRGAQLKVLGDFKYEKRFWGILWSFVRLSGDDDVAEAVNRAVKSKGGDGLINLTVESDYCALNGMPFLAMLPIWPGCTLARFSGEIVKLEGRREQ